MFTVMSLRCPPPLDLHSNSSGVITTEAGAVVGLRASEILDLYRWIVGESHRQAVDIYFDGKHMVASVFLTESGWWMPSYTHTNEQRSLFKSKFSDILNFMCGPEVLTMCDIYKYVIPSISNGYCVQRNIKGTHET